MVNKEIFFCTFLFSTFSWKLMDFLSIQKNKIDFLEDKIRYNYTKLRILEKKIAELEDFKFKLYEKNIFIKEDQWGELTDSDYSDDNDLEDDDIWE